MRLVNYERDGQERPGVIVNDFGDILDIQSVMPDMASMNDFVDAGYEAVDLLAGHLMQSPFQIRSATGQHRRHGGVSGGGKGRGQGL